jgi:hypothetical protein
VRAARALALAVLALSVAAPAASANVCDTTERHPGKPTWWNRGAPPLAIGDSTMLLSARLVGKLGLMADARACRQLPQAVQMLRERRRSGSLPSMVVLFMGANGSVQRAQLQQAMRALGPARVLVLVTSPEKGGRPGADAATARAFARAHPERVKLLDWVRHSRAHRGWFYEDGLHPSHPGAGALARFISTARRWYPQPAPCGAQVASRATTPPAGATAGIPLCADFTGDRITDMVVPFVSGEPAAVRQWSLYSQLGDTWRRVHAERGALLASHDPLGTYELSVDAPRTLVITAPLAAGCDGSPARTGRFELRWRTRRFVVSRADSVA